jgi:hypothetical protein
MAKVGNGGVPGTTGPSKKGSGPYPAEKQTKFPVGVSKAPGKKPPLTGKGKKGSPK